MQPTAILLFILEESGSKTGLGSFSLWREFN
nr:MAG TPA: hypothetical protein [Herelleviridae sp.]